MLFPSLCLSVRNNLICPTFRVRARDERVRKSATLSYIYFDIPITPRMILQPLPDIHFANHSDHPEAVRRVARAIQPHDVPTDGPDVLPRRVKQRPPVIRCRYVKVPRSEQDSGADDRRHRVQCVYGGLKATKDTAILS